MRPQPHFASFFMGGFECSTHRRHDGRLDLLKSTGHDGMAAADFRQLQSLGIRTVRSGLRWHRIETEPGRYDFSSDLPMIRAAQETGTQVIWDLFHYGWPDFLDLFSPLFVEHFRSFAGAAARLLRSYTSGPLYLSPVNEVSFFAYAAGDKRFFYPFEAGRGHEVKDQLVRAALAATEAVREAAPGVRIVHPEPVIHLAADPANPVLVAEAATYEGAQYEAWDMLAGRIRPELGGREDSLDILGINFYPHNQWLHFGYDQEGRPLRPEDPLYRPFREMLAEVYARYRRPLFVSETGAEGDERPGWLAYVMAEVRAALEAGIPVQGVCLYPVTDYPAWDDDRHCPTGLLSHPKPGGSREVYGPLAEELRRQQRLLADLEVRV